MHEDKSPLIYDTISLVLDEYYNAVKSHPRFNSRHEGYAILLEEVEELWEVIKKNHIKEPDSKIKMKKEAIQVCAMSLRFINECCGDENPKW